MSPKPHQQIGNEDRLTLMEHLGELRQRLVYSALALVVGVAGAAIFNDQLLTLLLRPLPADRNKLLTLGVAEAMTVSFHLWLTVGIVVASPFLLYQLWAFVAPALAPKEKKYVAPVVTACTVLFLGGVAFGYFVILPTTIKFMINFNGAYFDSQLRASYYFSFTTLFLVALGACFEMPVLIALTTRLGLVNPKLLRRYRRYAILGNAALAAVATPSPDALTMLMVFFPLLALYEISIWVSKVIVDKRRADDAGGESPGDAASA